MRDLENFCRLGAGDSSVCVDAAVEFLRGRDGSPCGDAIVIEQIKR